MPYYRATREKPLGLPKLYQTLSPPAASNMHAFTELKPVLYHNHNSTGGRHAPSDHSIMSYESKYLDTVIRPHHRTDSLSTNMSETYIESVATYKPISMKIDKLELLAAEMEQMALDEQESQQYGHGRRQFQFNAQQIHHRCQDRSAVEPTHVSRARKYVMTQDIIDYTQLRQDASIALDMYDIDPAEQYTSIYQPTYTSPTEGEISYTLYRLCHAYGYGEDTLKRLKLRNPWPGVNLHHGWMRARCEIDTYHQVISNEFPTLKNGIEERVNIKQSLNGFSMWRQKGSIEFDEQDLLNIGYKKVFFGEGNDGSWAREPGSWGSKKKKTMAGCKGVTFGEEIDDLKRKIEKGVAEWAKEGIQPVGFKKRKRGYISPRARIGDEDLIKRMKTRSGSCTRVMSEEWRAKRRMQEKKAGRWTDGTERMDKLWNEFYWVLDNDDIFDTSRWEQIRHAQYWQNQGLRIWFPTF